MFIIPSSNPPEESEQPPSSALNAATTKKKRRPAGTPDPEAEVISLSPHTLLESERYVCEICLQSFRRSQNLQMHLRRHRVPWKLAAKRTESKKRVFVCPEASCLHHHPRHALGDLVGIKKHFRRKHSGNRQWGCARCSKAYAVLSDYKAHLKTCGTRGHCCDCGRVFSRVEAFIEHQDSCTAPATQSPPSPPPPPPPSPPAAPIVFIQQSPNHSTELSLLPSPSNHPSAADLHLSIAPPPPPAANATVADLEREEVRVQVQIAERELAAARIIRQQAQAELQKACALRTAAARQINSVLLHITCGDCRQRIGIKCVRLAGRDDGGGDESDGDKSV
ncbi:protein indeterminate-domain 14-like [Phalaenopsis equestris]|uniref:protein indeterminate-domain 14-like n=1 Tax=Phalaenopsis equestris TaxID=78828 RepID=UPI0009E29465|nr:protein indeterminate-domain 14-like [Phalaenopsis equestris]